MLIDCVVYVCVCTCVRVCTCVCVRVCVCVFRGVNQFCTVFFTRSRDLYLTRCVVAERVHRVRDGLQPQPPPAAWRSTAQDRLHLLLIELDNFCGVHV